MFTLFSFVFGTRSSRFVPLKQEKMKKVETLTYFMIQILFYPFPLWRCKGRKLSIKNSLSK